MRQLWLNNFEVHLVLTRDIKNGYMHTWTGDVAKRGADEIISSLLAFF